MPREPHAGHLASVAHARARAAPGSRPLPDPFFACVPASAVRKEAYVRLMRLSWLLVPFVLLVASSSCKTAAVRNKKAEACGTFEGGKLSAKWTECPDKIGREVTCAPFIDQLKCDCYEDG